MTVFKREMEIKKDKKVADMAIYQLTDLSIFPRSGMTIADIKGIMMTRTGKLSAKFILPSETWS